ncbi:MAG: H-NS histone family protein [Pseudomonadota bacterium]
MANDLKSMTSKQLERLAKDIQKEIENRSVRDRADAMKAAEKAAKQHGFDLAELLEAAPKKRAPQKKKSAKKPPLPAKYKNPENFSQTWSGRGRQPEWFKQAVSTGKSPDDLLI